MRKRELTIREFARLGGQALAKKRTKAERAAAARHAALARWAKARAIA